MTRAQLEHAIRAGCEIANETEVIVFGSQAILGSHPDAPAELRQSSEADLMPKHATGALDQIEWDLGQDSPFHVAHGFYVHAVPIAAARLPAGWEHRRSQCRAGIRPA